MTYKARNDKELMALLVHFEREVARHERFRTAPLPHDERREAGRNYRAACNAVLAHIEERVNGV